MGEPVSFEERRGVFGNRAGEDRSEFQIHRRSHEAFEQLSTCTLPGEPTHGVQTGHFADLGVAVSLGFETTDPDDSAAGRDTGTETPERHSHDVVAGPWSEEPFGNPALNQFFDHGKIVERQRVHSEIRIAGEQGSRTIEGEEFRVEFLSTAEVHTRNAGPERSTDRFGNDGSATRLVAEIVDVGETPRWYTPPTRIFGDDELLGAESRRHVGGDTGDLSVDREYDDAVIRKRDPKIGQLVDVIGNLDDRSRQSSSNVRCQSQVTTSSEHDDSGLVVDECADRRDKRIVDRSGITIGEGDQQRPVPELGEKEGSFGR